MGCVCTKNEVASTIQQATKETLFTTQSESVCTITRVDDLRIHPGTFIQRLIEPFSSHYTIVLELGSGNFGKVYKVRSKATMELRAVKEIDKSRAEKLGGSQNDFIAEVEILSRLDHPNILKIYEMFEDQQRYYIVSELCEGGELFDYIIRKKHLEEPTAASIMRQVLSAVAYCHGHNIVHRDLKPENLLLDSLAKGQEIVNVKLIDFGTSCLCERNQRLSKKLGTPYYIAPEVLESNYNEKCDVWSCGVILYILLCGFPPFAGSTDEEILRKVRIGKFNFSHPNWRRVSDSAKQLIKSMLTMDIRARPSAADCLANPWLQHLVSTSSRPDSHIALSLDHLQHFRHSEKLRQAFLSFITSKYLSKENESRMATAFRALDKNGDGKLSREELLEAYTTSMPLSQAQTVVENVMKQADIDGSGFLDYSEFLVACVSHEELLSKENLKAAFEAFDRDNSGKISAEELRTMLGSGNDADSNVWDSLIRQADHNGDGEIEYSEFLRLMLAATK